MEPYRFDPWTGMPLRQTRPWPDNSYSQRNAPKPPPQEQPNVIVTRVASYDEAKAIPTDFSGVLRIMLDWTNGYIYAKALGNDGNPVFRKFRYEPDAPPSPVPQARYAPIEELDQLREDMRNLREETATEVNRIREEFTAVLPLAKETAEKPAGKGNKA
ncbi:hypothetical protein AALC17_02950 [Oscillospiraceae bacterium 38-13]